MDRFYFVDAQGKEYSINGEIKLNVGDTKRLSLKGRLNTKEEVILQGVDTTYTQTSPNVSIDSTGLLTANGVGASLIYGQVKVGSSEIRTSDLWVNVADPSEFLAEEYIFSNTTLTHPNMIAEIGQPAFIELGDSYPCLAVHSTIDGRVSGKLIVDGTTVVEVILSTALKKGETTKLTLPGKADKQGGYELRLTIEQESVCAVYDSYYFTVWKQREIPAEHSRIAFLDTKDKMVYVSDFRGNKIIDFSNSGYGGGGVRLPNVPVKEIIESSEGDNMACVQAAIDRVAQLPMNEDGFRGAVLLKRGKYDIGGTLYIRTGGIVLRGEGDGADGTIIYGTGSTRRNLVEIGDTSSLTIDPTTQSVITDLYVPSGAKTLHVSDASIYQVGDKIIIRRMGNDRWVHEIGMDYIYNRPGGGAKQWQAFNLDFDREIIGIDGNEITVEAPIASAIEHKWGGGQLFKYNDDSRIEQVGVEYMRVVSDFDPSIVDTVMDNDSTDPYYSDENHAERFVVFNSVKNGWVRNVTGYHLSYSLVQVSRNAKWITVQDTKTYEMVSIVTGSRRYVIHFMGQLSLSQRNYTETARHAFVVDSFVPGPNVFLDSESTKDYNTSEPHHRWSVGGLFDCIKGVISIRDRAWLGSGHGWSGANYVTWNTEGNLTSQQPPTAQNYAIGHIGPKVAGLVPSAYDPRWRSDAYWEQHGSHVKVVSLYKQQLKERLGEQAIENMG